MNALNLVFAGTPAFTLPSLDALYASRHRIRSVYTQPDRPAGRGRTLQASATKNWAIEHNIPVYQPAHLKDQASIDELKALNPDVLVVIAYGLILPEAVLNIPRLGCINVHGSILPDWRGAAPIQYSILNGDSTTGVSIMQMDKGMDTGPVFHTATCPITRDTTTETLHDTLAHLAKAPLLKTLDELADGSAKAIPQAHQHATYAPKITKEDAVIDWRKSAIAIEQLIRAFNPWPIARTNAGEHTLRIHQAHAVDTPSTDITVQPGTILSLDTFGLTVATGLGVLCVKTIQFPGGKTLSITDWLNANKKSLYPGLVLT